MSSESDRLDGLFLDKLDIGFGSRLFFFFICYGHEVISDNRLFCKVTLGDHFPPASTSPTVSTYNVNTPQLKHTDRNSARY